MSSETFQNSEVASYLNENFISIRINTENDPKTADLYKVRGIPVSWFLKSGGERMGVIPGFIPPAKMIELLERVQEKS